MDLSGVFPPVATPFAGDDVDLQALRRNVERYLTTPLRGVVVLGSNGEAPAVDDEEARFIVAAAREGVPSDRLLIAGTGRESTGAAIRAATTAAEAGADAVLVRPPGFFKTQLTATVLIDHYRRVADASPVPVLLYNFATAFGVDLGLEVVAPLAAHPNVAGLKESGGDISRVGDVVSQTHDGFAVLVGSAQTFYGSLCMGADGGILALACVVPDACVRLRELTLAGRHQDALALQRALTPLARAVTTRFGVPGLKAALALAGYDSGTPRLPLAPASPETVAEIERHLATAHAGLDASLAPVAGGG